MKRIISILGLVGLLTAPAAFAQSSTHTPFQQPEYYAVDYGQWAIKSQQANTYIFQPGGLCGGTASGSQFFVFATNAPVLINDATSANSEVVTISNPVNQGSQCGFSASPVNNHFSFQVQSGTAGLQEALNALAVSASTTAYPAKINLDRNWWTSANSIPGTSGTTILGAAKGNAHAILVDITTAGSASYTWNGTAYAAGTWVNTAPTLAAGVAAGTAPTVSNTANSTQLAGTANVTSGTATTTGALFTETFPVTANGGFGYAGTCTVVSSGTNSFTAFTVAVTKPGTQMILTVTATSAPAVSTAYKFSYNCK